MTPVGLVIIVGGGGGDLAPVVLQIVVQSRGIFASSFTPPRRRWDNERFWMQTLHGGPSAFFEGMNAPKQTI